MTYKTYKTGTFKVCVYLTILIEALAFIREDQSYTTILGIFFSHWEIPVVSKTSVYIEQLVFQFMGLQRNFRPEVEISLDAS